MTPPHPLPGGEYDRDGFLYHYHVEENLRHNLVRTTTAVLLMSYLERRHGDRALVASDCGLYARPIDRFAKPLAPDIMVSLTAGDLDAPGTPPREDRMSYKLWQEPVPDLILEIISSSSVTRDTVEKPKLYEKLGIPEFWLFDPHRDSDTPNGLRGWYLIDGRYRDAPPRTPAPDQARLATGAVGHWSEVLGLYLYADGPELRFHHPRTGRMNDHGEEIDARIAAEELAAAEQAALQEGRAGRREVQAALREEQAGRREEQAALREEQAGRREVQAALREEQAALQVERAGRQEAEERAAALEAELRALRRVP